MITRKEVLVINERSKRYAGYSGTQKLLELELAHCSNASAASYLYGNFVILLTLLLTFICFLVYKCFVVKMCIRDRDSVTVLVWRIIKWIRCCNNSRVIYHEMDSCNSSRMTYHEMDSLFVIIVVWWCIMIWIIFCNNSRMMYQ